MENTTTTLSKPQPEDFTFDLWGFLYAQSKLLADWNKQNINGETEQVRKNLETIIAALRFLY